MLRSTSSITTRSPCSSTPTGTGSHNDDAVASVIGHAIGSAPSNGSRRTTRTLARAASRRSRTTRTSRARRHAATCSVRLSSSATDCPRRTRTSSRSPAETRLTDHTPGQRNGPDATPESTVARAHARRTRIACSSRSTNRRAGPDSATAATITATAPAGDVAELARDEALHRGENDQPGQLDAHAPQRPCHPAEQHDELLLRPFASPFATELVDQVHDRRPPEHQLDLRRGLLRRRP